MDLGDFIKVSLRDALDRSSTRVIDLFKAWDEDESGFIDAKEFGRAIKALGFEASKEEIAAVIRPATELDAVLARAGAPRTAAELGWPHDFYVRAVSHARLIRNRYTFLDLASGAGLPLDS